MSFDGDLMEHWSGKCEGLDFERLKAEQHTETKGRRVFHIFILGLFIITVCFYLARSKISTLKIGVISLRLNENFSFGCWMCELLGCCSVQIVLLNIWLKIWNEFMGLLCSTSNRFLVGYMQINFCNSLLLCS